MEGVNILSPEEEPRSKEQACQTDARIVTEQSCQTNIVGDIIDGIPEPTITEVLRSDKSIRACTGLSSLKQFTQFCRAVDYALVQLHAKSSFKLDVESQILLTLMKLKLNVSFTCLGCFFKLSERTVIDYFFYNINILYSLLKQFIVWLPEDKLAANLPVYFTMFSDTCVVVDCAEIPVKQNSCLNCSIRTYSHYKGTNTIKFLVGIAPCGVIMFLSKAYGGRASDKFIFNDSKVLQKCSPGQGVMTDKGFNIDSECKEAGVNLYKPPKYFKKNTQFTGEEVETCRKIARARVHVERTIQRIRLFRILKDRLEWMFLQHIDKILTVVSALVNLSPSILDDKRFLTE